MARISLGSLVEWWHRELAARTDGIMASIERNTGAWPDEARKLFTDALGRTTRELLEQAARGMRADDAPLRRTLLGREPGRAQPCARPAVVWVSSASFHLLERYDHGVPAVAAMMRAPVQCLSDMTAPCVRKRPSFHVRPYMSARTSYPRIVLNRKDDKHFVPYKQ